MATEVNELIGPVHNSHLSSVKLCEKKFEYEFVQQIEAKKPSMPLARGIWLHYMLEAQHLRWGHEAGTLLDGLPESLHVDGVGEVTITSSPSAGMMLAVQINEEFDYDTYPLSAKGMLNLLTDHVWERLLEGERGKYTGDDGVTLPDACERILREYFYHYNKWPLPEGAKILGVETNWAREHHDVDFEGRGDLVYVTKKGLIVVRDWKSTTKAPNNNFKFIDNQLHLYPWGLVPWLISHGIDAKKATHSAVEYDYLITKLPTIPKINKDGTTSKRQISTTRLTVSDFVRENNLKWTKADLDHFMDTYTTDAIFFDQRPVPRNQSVIHELLDENVAATARMLPVLKGERVAVRHTGRHCEYMCDFLPLCMGELYGNDVRYMRKKDYQPRNYLRFDRDSEDDE